MTDKKTLIKAIFNRHQKQAFEKEFKIKPIDLDINVDGYMKHVLLEKKQVYILYRNHQFYNYSKNEIKVSEWLNCLSKTSVPKLIKKVTNKDISPYPILVTQKLEGELLSKVMQKISEKELMKIFENIAKCIAEYHEQSIINPPKITKHKLSKNITKEEWLYYIVNSETHKTALDFAYNKIKKYLNTRNKKETLSLWQKTLEPIIKLQPVLNHNDIHEAQILITNKNKVSGILDWGDAHMNNPVLEFNFNEWLGFDTKEFLIKHIYDIRKTMWNEYTKLRNIKTVKYENIKLLYSIRYALNTEKFTNEFSLTYQKFARENLEWLNNFK